jgi:hypothetical protein
VPAVFGGSGCIVECQRAGGFYSTIFSQLVSNRSGAYVDNFNMGISVPEIARVARDNWRVIGTAAKPGVLAWIFSNGPRLPETQ